jgi:hypothetical protein
VPRPPSVIQARQGLVIDDVNGPPAFTSDSRLFLPIGSMREVK